MGPHLKRSQDGRSFEEGSYTNWHLGTALAFARTRGLTFVYIAPNPAPSIRVKPYARGEESKCDVVMALAAVCMMRHKCYWYGAGCLGRACLGFTVRVKGSAQQVRIDPSLRAFVSYTLFINT